MYRKSWLTILRYVYFHQKLTPCSYRSKSTYIRGPVGLKSGYGSGLGPESTQHDPEFALSKSAIEASSKLAVHWGPIDVVDAFPTGDGPITGIEKRLPPSCRSLCIAKGEDAEVFRQPEGPRDAKTIGGCPENCMKHYQPLLKII